MKSRLLASTLAAVAVAVVLLGVPLVVGAHVVIVNQALTELEDRATELPAAVLRLATEPEGRDELLRTIAADGRRFILYSRSGGDLLIQFDTAADRPLPGFDDDLAAAQRRAEPGQAYRGGLLAVTVPFDLGGRTLFLRALEDDAAVLAEVRAVRGAIAALAVVSLLAATLAAAYQSRRLAIPLENLAASARRLGDGDFSARAPRTGLPEPDEVAAALDSTAARLAAMLERSRSFNADASHQLRTPLTALRLDLEALEQTGADPALVAAAVAEADRLEATIDELLTLAEAPRGDERLDLGEIAAERLDAWRSLARAQGRDVVLRVAGEVPPPVRARSAAIGQSLQVLLDNALEHGRGTITVTVGEVAGGVRLCVMDEGPGIAPDREAVLFAAPDGNGSGGRGLPLARSLIEAEGGRITIDHASVCLLLPTATPRAPAPDVRGAGRA